MDKYIIRKINKDEIEIALEVIKDAFKPVAEEFNLTKENCPRNSAFLKLETLKSDYNKVDMFGIYLNDKLIGFVQLECNSGIHNIERLSICERYKGFGYGEALINHIKGYIISKGSDIIKLGMINDNIKLKKWYIKQGFSEIKVKRFKGLPYKVCFMRCKLEKGMII